nr:hypothetical protein [Bacteroidota bacterium]
MKNTFKLEVMNTQLILTKIEQDAFKVHLKHLLKSKGMISMCVEAENLYVEFNPKLFNLESFKSDLKDIGFPLKQDINLAALHIAV